MMNVLESIRKQQELDAQPRDPLDVEVLFAGSVVSVRMPYLRRDAFAELTDRFPGRDAQGCWFDLTKTVANHPDIELVDGDDVNNLYELRGKDAVYLWPEVFASLSTVDRRSVEAAFWGLYVYEPRLALERARKERA